MQKNISNVLYVEIFNSLIKYILYKQKQHYKQVLLYKSHHEGDIWNIVYILFTSIQQMLRNIVINFCKQFAKNDYFDFSGILYSFAAASA